MIVPRKIVIATVLSFVLGLGFQGASFSVSGQAATPDFTPTTPKPSLFLDVDWYRTNLITSGTAASMVNRAWARIRPISTVSST